MRIVLIILSLAVFSCQLHKKATGLVPKMNASGDKALIRQYERYLGFEDSANGIIQLDHEQREITAAFHIKRESKICDGSLKVNGLEVPLNRFSYYEYYQDEVRGFCGSEVHIDYTGSQIIGDISTSIKLSSPLRIVEPSLKPNDSALVDRHKGLLLRWNADTANKVGICIRLNFDPLSTPYINKEKKLRRSLPVPHIFIVPDKGTFLLSPAALKEIPKGGYFSLTIERLNYKTFLNTQGQSFVIKAYSDDEIVFQLED